MNKTIASNLKLIKGISILAVIISVVLYSSCNEELSQINNVNSRNTETEELPPSVRVYVQQFGNCSGSYQPGAQVTLIDQTDEIAYEDVTNSEGFAGFSILPGHHIVASATHRMRYGCTPEAYIVQSGVGTDVYVCLNDMECKW